jgi:prevent-host-death family protein
MSHDSKRVLRISATQFRRSGLRLLNEVDRTQVVITKHGIPVARLVPYQRDHQDLIGGMRGKLRIEGDILSTGLHWEAER